MIIAIHILVLYFIECCHYYNDVIHTLFGKKTVRMIQNERIIKECEQDYLFWKMKKQLINQLKNCQYVKIHALQSDLTSEKTIEIWKFEETTESQTKTVIIGHSCEICGNYDYSFPYCNCVKCKDSTRRLLDSDIVERYPYCILCKCEKYNHF
jgi:hypothetical protein